MVQEFYTAPAGAPALAMVCAMLAGLGFSQDVPAGEALVKSAGADIALVYGFAGVRAVAEVDTRGEASIVFTAASRAQLAPVLRLLNETEVPGTNRPIVALLKSAAQAKQEKNQRRQKIREMAQLLADAPAREAQARAAARQESAWRCRAIDLAGVESRLIACGAVVQPGADGLPSWQLGGSTISMRLDAGGLLAEVRLVGYVVSDYSTARRIITAGRGEMLMPVTAGQVVATPRRIKKSKSTGAQPRTWADLKKSLP